MVTAPSPLWAPLLTGDEHSAVGVMKLEPPPPADGEVSLA
jgi:hypothetical protein